MKKAWIQGGTTAAAALAVLLVGLPLKAQDNTGIRTVAEELDKRTKPAPADSGGKLSDSAVRVMATFAWSIIPDQVPGPDGKPAKLDKSDPKKFFIPIDDARRIIRVATRSAYAEACNLVDLEKANFDALMKTEEGRKLWSREQMIFINALHMFSVSYFTGNVQLTEKDDAADAGKSPDAGAPAAEGGTQLMQPKKLTCSPEQKEKVKQSITAYVQAAQAAPPAAQSTPEAVPQAAQPAPQAAQPVPVTGAAN
jgi:hypothetical protein